MRSYLKYLVFILFLVLCIGITFFILSNEKENEEIVYISEFLICTKDKEYEIKVDKSTKYTLFRENDVEELMYAYPREGKARLVFPNLDEIMGENTLLGREEVVNYTYNMSYSDSFKYLKYLVNEGYHIEMYVCSPQYIEVFLLKDTVYKRIVLFSDTMMVCDMVEGTELPPVWEYLRPYNFNSFVENKFNIELKNSN